MAKKAKSNGEQLARDQHKRIEYAKLMQAKHKAEPVEDFLDEIWNHFPGAQVTYHGPRRRHEGIDYGE